MFYDNRIFFGIALYDLPMQFEFSRLRFARCGAQSDRSKNGYDLRDTFHRYRITPVYPRQ